MADVKRAWTTPALSGEPYDRVCWKTIEEAMDYIQQELADFIDRKFTEDELVEHGYTLHIGCEEMTVEQFEAMYRHGETVDLEGG